MSTEIQQFDELAGKIKVFVGPVKELTVTDTASNAVASGTLRTIKDMAKQIEDRRVAMVKPLNDQVRMVNARASIITLPLDEAEKHVKSLMAKFADEQKRQREVEQKRIEEENRAKQEQLRKEAADRQKKIDEDAAVERKRFEAEQKKKEKEEAAKQKAEKPSFFGNSKATAMAEAKEKAAAERQEFDRKQEEVKASEIARAERELLEQQKIAEQRRREIEASRPKNTREVTKFEVMDLSILPREYTLPDEKKISAAVALGKEIPGVRVYKETVVVAR